MYTSAGFCDDSSDALGERASWVNNVENFVTSLIDDPKSSNAHLISGWRGKGRGGQNSSRR